MCTLTYVPLPDGQVLLTSNRDEAVTRKGATLPMEVTLENGTRAWMPIDQEAGGTWIGMALHQRCAVLLNGAFEPHMHQPPYRISRGLVVREALAAPDIVQFAESYNLDRIEPFTMVVWEGAPAKLLEWRWDGQNRYLYAARPYRPHIWSAAQLYPGPVRRDSEARFDALLESNPGPDAIWQFHEEEAYQTKMKRHGLEAIPILQTLSRISFRAGESGFSMRYHDLTNDRETRNDISWST
jgi:hypothetical protein